MPFFLHLLGLAAFAQGTHVVGAVTSHYGVLLATRVIAALANAGFLAVALATATAVAPPNAKGRATSVLLGGTTMACIAGVPAGALLGEVWGWRAAFWAVALLSVPAVLAIVWSVPTGGETPAHSSARDQGVPRPDAAAAAREEPGARDELRALVSPRLLVTQLLGALVNGATFCTFTYLAPLVTDVSGIGAGWVPAVLALFGLGSFAGVSAGGRLADTRPVTVLLTGGVALLVGWSALALAAGSPAATVVLVLVQGTLSFAVGSTLISQALYAATDAPTLAGGFATAAVNVGAALGSWLGGAALTTGLGYRAAVWISVLLVALALLTGGTAQVVATRRETAAADKDRTTNATPTTPLPDSP